MKVRTQKIFHFAYCHYWFESLLGQFPWLRLDEMGQRSGQKPKFPKSPKIKIEISRRLLNRFLFLFIFHKDMIEYYRVERVRAFGDAFKSIFHPGIVGDFSKIHFLAPRFRARVQGTCTLAGGSVFL